MNKRPRKCMECGKPSYGRRCMECFKKETSPSKQVTRIRQRIRLRKYK